jgi:hypothetical protein
MKAGVVAQDERAAKPWRRPDGALYSLLSPR